MSDPPRPPLRLAFLGCGFATEIHSRTLRRLGGHFRRYYASRAQERARAFNDRFGGDGAFGSYDEALAADDVDAVLVATPPALHLDLTLRALQAGKHVIVEKPPFLRSSDFAAVEEACRATGRRVLVAENYFYKPVAVTLRRILAAGLIGEVRFLYVNALKHQPIDGWRQDTALAGGGALFEGGIHWINLLATLGLPVASARGFPRGDGDGPERSVLVVLEYAQGAVGTLYYSWETPSPLKGLRVSRIYGGGGSIAFESNGLFVALHGTKTRLYVPGLSDIAGYRAMFLDFGRALATGQEPLMTLHQARRDLEIVEAVYRSLHTADAEARHGA